MSSLTTEQKAAREAAARAAREAARKYVQDHDVAIAQPKAKT